MSNLPKRTKRSKKVTPAILGSIMSLALLTACGDDDTDANVFETVEQCAASGEYTQAECQQYFDEAKAADAQAAPQYTNQTDCEEEFGPGRCGEGPEIDVVHHYHSYFPLRAAILIGAHHAQPLYRPYSNHSFGAFTTYNGMTVSSSTGRTRFSSSVLSSRPSRSTGTLSRGGFGSMSRSVSS